LHHPDVGGFPADASAASSSLLHMPFLKRSNQSNTPMMRFSRALWFGADAGSSVSKCPIALHSVSAVSIGPEDPVPPELDRRRRLHHRIRCRGGRTSPQPEFKKWRRRPAGGASGSVRLRVALLSTCGSVVCLAAASCSAAWRRSSSILRRLKPIAGSSPNDRRSQSGKPVAVTCSLSANFYSRNPYRPARPRWVTHDAHPVMSDAMAA